jgi:hypothetical protein
MTEPQQIGVNVEHRTATPSELDRLFDQHGFAEKLKRCSVITICDEAAKPEDTFHASLLKHKSGKKFKDPETQHSIAVIFTYTHQDGRVVRNIWMLRIGNIVHDVAVRNR